MTLDKSWEIIIIGAGPAGSTAAFLLASHGYDVLLIDKMPFPRPKLCAGLLTWKSIGLIQSIFNLSAGDLIEQNIVSSHTRDYRIYYTGTEIARGRLDFPFHFIERSAYDHLWLKMAGKAGACIVTGQSVLHVDPQTGLVQLCDGTCVRGQVVIGADGVWSTARRSVINGTLANRQWNNRLTMTMESYWSCPGEGPPRNFAALHFGFVPWGYAWSFPSRHHQIVGIAGLRHADHQPLSTSFDCFLTSIGVPKRELGANRAYPLPMGNYLDPPGRERVLLAGDACGLADPLLGEGIYYAHRSAEIAARTIIRCGPGSKNLARQYGRALSDRVICELRWIKAFRNLLFTGGRKRRFRGLRMIFKIMPKRLESAVQGQISFCGLIWPGIKAPLQKTLEK